MKSNLNQLKIGSFLSYLQMALGVIIGLIYTPIMIRLLGKSEYGLYNTVSSTISMLSILSLGFNSSYIRYYSKYKKANDENSINKLNGLFLIIFTVIGIIAFLCGFYLTNNLHLVFDQGLTDSEYEIAKVLMFILTISLALSFPMSVFSSIISAHEKYVFLKLLGMLKTVVSPLLSIPLLLLGHGSIAIVSLTLIITVVTDICYFTYVKFKLNQKFVFRNFEKGLFKSLFIYTSFIAINLIVDQINLNVDKLLLGRFKGTEVVAVYSVGYSLYQYFVMFSTAISSVFTPRIHRIINQTTDNIELRNLQITNLFIKVGRVQFLLLGLVASGIVFFGQPFIHFWAGENYEDSYVVALLLILPAMIALIQNIGIEVQRAENKHQFRSIVYLAMATINVILSIFLCQLYGAIGSAVGTAISLIVANGIIMNIYYHKKCGINIIAFWKNILRMSLGLILPIICGVIIVKFINLYSIINLLIFILIYTIIYCISVWFMSMNKEEKEIILKPIKILSKNIKLKK